MEAGDQLGRGENAYCDRGHRPHDYPQSRVRLLTSNDEGRQPKDGSHPRRVEKSTPCSWAQWSVLTSVAYRTQHAQGDTNRQSHATSHERHEGHPAEPGGRAKADA
jgi:hypothetical protein